ncbi:TetR/AcrR family transcriptional regulator [Williamsia herbipolensis]|uniref:TetR/AcrR family transcriptional regulator n=1 Tax=Williamsia herbipolensis TaxID=1603258 RepID=A0AAU4JYE4_9NOCA|nr:TetR/AcrR family transcriptional regulator [Williamsia herbipolensis]
MAVRGMEPVGELSETLMATPDVRILPGVFFDPPGSLPRGRHNVPREVVAAAQRERLMIAITELMARQGYGDVTVTDVVQRAKVSRSVFYGFFEDKQACALASYDRFIGVLLDSLAGELDADQNLPEFVAAGLRAYLRPIGRDPVVGRAFQVEIDAMGEPARRRRRESLQLFADALATHHARIAVTDPTTECLPPSAYLGVVYAVRQLTSDALEVGQTAGLLDLVPELSQWMLRMLTRAPA